MAYLAPSLKAVCSASRAICPRLGACGYAFARSCRAQNTILLASSKKAQILPSSLTKHVLVLPIHPNRRPTAGTARCMHLVGGSDARGWCREAQLPPLEDSWRAVSGASEGVLSDDFVAPAPTCSDTRGHLQLRYRGFTPRLCRSREGAGRRGPLRHDRCAANQGSRGGGGGWWWWRSIRRPRSAAGGPPTHPPDGPFAARTRRVGAVLGGPLALAAPSPRPFDRRWAGTLFGQAGARGEGGRLGRYSGPRAPAASRGALAYA